MLSIDPIQLRVLQDQGTPYEKNRAKEIEDLLTQHHLLLVTLLLTNSIALEALPIFLNKCVSEIEAVALSVTLILLFGEIIPQAACTGKNQISIAMWAARPVQLLMTALWPMSCPIAKLLDCWVGEGEGQTLYARSHLKALIRLHQREARSNLNSEGARSAGGELQSALCADEVVVIEGALDMASKSAAHVMVPIEKVYMLEEQSVLTPSLRQELLERGHSRVPVFHVHRWNVRGLLYVKSLICIDSHESPVIGNLIQSNRAPIFCHPDMSLYDLLNEFQRGRHMAFITQNPQWHLMNWGGSPPNTVEQPELGARRLSAVITESSQTPVEDEWEPTDDRALIGIATLEDVIEELIQEEIYDEFDNYNSQVNEAVMRPMLPAAKNPVSAKVPLKLSFIPPRIEERNELSEKLLSGEYASGPSSAPLNSLAAIANRSSKDGLVVVKNLKTVFGINQARRTRKTDDFMDNMRTEALIDVRDE